MYRTVLLGVFATVMCLGVPASLVLAKPVKHGAVEICSAIDGGEVTVVDGTEVCCSHVVGGTYAGEYYCVQCDPPGSDNCEEFISGKAPFGDARDGVRARSRQPSRGCVGSAAGFG